MEGGSQLVVLVDENDRELGTEEKIKAHMNGGKLHRAISIFVINSNGETMLQQRALSKYHTPGLWSNTCCSHPFPNESVLDAAHRRLKEEMGFDCEMKEAFSFIYKTPVGNGLTEWEYDHVIFGSYEGVASPNPEEVADWRWVSFADLKREVANDGSKFTPWLKIVLDRVIEYYNSAKR
ncbi:MAG: isopentenyl-diphosphate Delta-isomerase [Candidatus Micrarchaeaceae archaeon]